MLEVPTNPTIVWVLAAAVSGLVFIALAGVRLLAQLVKSVNHNGFQAADRLLMARMEQDLDLTEKHHAAEEGLLKGILAETKMHRADFAAHLKDFGCVARRVVPQESSNGR